MISQGFLRLFCIFSRPSNLSAGFTVGQSIVSFRSSEITSGNIAVSITCVVNTDRSNAKFQKITWRRRRRRIKKMKKMFFNKFGHLSIFKIVVAATECCTTFATPDASAMYANKNQKHEFKVSWYLKPLHGNRFH